MKNRELKQMNDKAYIIMKKIRFDIIKKWEKVTNEVLCFLNI